MLANFVSANMDDSNNSGGSSGTDSTGSQLGGSMVGTNSGVNELRDNETKRVQAPYSMPGVLHYIQNEWGRYELERAQWEMERSELKARITFLMGERKSQENLKHDLVRRIKMLEYALKQERNKYQQLLDSGDLQTGDSTNNEQSGEHPTMPAVKSTVPLDIDAIYPPIPKSVIANQQATSEVTNQEWAKARETLRQYLQEIGYTEKILDVRSFRVKHMLGLNKQDNHGSKNAIGVNAEQALLESEQAILEAADSIKQSRGGEDKGQKSQSNKKGHNDEEEDSDSSGADAELGLDADAVEAFNEFSFLKNARDGGGKITAKQSIQTKESLEAMKERLRCDQERRRQQNIAQGKQPSKEEFQLPVTHTSSKFSSATSPSKPRNISVDAVHGIPPNIAPQQNAGELNFEEDKFEGTKAGYEEDEDEQGQLRWNIRYTLRSHYDSIRALQFHPVEPILITASEDGTAKLWDLNHSAVAGTKGSANDGSGKASQFPQPATGIVDIEPIYTFRGHQKAILTMDMSSTGDSCYTAGLDGWICCWTVPSTIGQDIYQNFDANILQERLHGHQDAVWSLCFHSSSNRLISASADGTIRIWIVGLADGAMPSPLLKTIQEVNRPHSIDLVSTESQQLLTACARAQCHIRDIETGQIVVQFQMRENGDDALPGEVNKILSHPTMPVTITASDDRKIRFFDNNSGKLINSTMAHVEGVSTIAIDPNGLYMLSASHDGSVRLWNAEKRICQQEIAAHRKKLDSGVMAVAFHPSRQLIGSAGADSLAKVYGSVRSSPRGSLIAYASPPSSAGSSGPSSLVSSPQKQQHIASSQL